MAAPPLEAATRGGRVLIISTATVSLLLVGMLALLMTPNRARNADDDAEAIVTDFVTFAPAAGSPEGSSSRTESTPPTTPADIADPAGGRSVISPAVTSAFGNAGSGVATTVSVPMVAVTIAGAVVVTPIGDGLAVTTESAVDGAAESIDALLPSGEAVRADIIVASDGVVFVAVAGTESSMAIADDVTATDVLYLSIGGTTTPVDSTALAAMVIPEATPVVDAGGNLVGLCTYGPDGIEVVPVGTLPELPATTTAPAESSTPTESVTASSPASTTTTAPTEVPSSEPDASSPVVTSSSTSSSSTSTSTSTSTSVPER